MTHPPTAIISDLHGNLPALETALVDALRRGARRFVCLGDVVGYGARPRACLDLVMALCVPEPTALPTSLAQEAGAEPLLGGLCLQGNHEQALLDSPEGFNAYARQAIEWTHRELSGGGERERSYAYWDFIGALEPCARENGVMFAHGSPRGPVREYMLPSDIRDEAKMRANFDSMDAAVCFVGHSHVPAVYFEDRRIHLPAGSPEGSEEPYDLGDLDDPSSVRTIVNVGSVGQPRDGDPRLSYVLFDGRELTFIRLDYDLARAQADIRAVAELPDYLANRLALGR